MRSLAVAFALGLGITGTLVACGGDDQTGGNPTPGADAGKDGSTDGGKDGAADGSTDGGADSGCGFVSFVNDQVANQKKDNTAPVANTAIPDPTCSLDAGTAAFSSLFP